MIEPVLHTSEKRDSLDLMHEMNVQELLAHPVIIEIINLIYEGEYSVRSSKLGLSKTFACLFELRTDGQKSIIQRLAHNVANFGEDDEVKQSSIMYNIWRQNMQ